MADIVSVILVLALLIAGVLVFTRFAAVAFLASLGVLAVLSLTWVWLEHWGRLFFMQVPAILLLVVSTAGMLNGHRIADFVHPRDPLGRTLIRANIEYNPPRGLEVDTVTGVLFHQFRLEGYGNYADTALFEEYLAFNPDLPVEFVGDWLDPGNRPVWRKLDQFLQRDSIDERAYHSSA
jgi:hypothetical protein